MLWDIFKKNTGKSPLISKLLFLTHDKLNSTSLQLIL
jgi:hypothetical protein